MAWRRQYCVEVFVPMKSGDGQPLSRKDLEQLKSMLADRFGGVTAYTRAPAEGLWEQGGSVDRDDIVVLEVMVDGLDTPAWAKIQQELQSSLKQDEIIVRARKMERLMRPT
jgi:hypothetical protein